MMEEVFFMKKLFIALIPVLLILGGCSDPAAKKLKIGTSIPAATHG